MDAPHTTSASPLHLVARQRAHTSAATQGAVALRVADQAEQLRDTLDAFLALERLTTPSGRDDCETLEPTRTQMGALLRVLNDELARQIDALASATEALRTAGKGA